MYKKFIGFLAFSALISAPLFAHAWTSDIVGADGKFGIENISPITVTINNEAAQPGYWGVAIIGDDVYETSCAVPGSSIHSFVIDMPLFSNSINGLWQYSSPTAEDCSFASSTSSYQWGAGSFSIVGEKSLVVGAFSTNLLAMVSDAFNDPGLLLVIAIAAGLPLAFWAIRKVIGLIPKGRKDVKF